MIHLDTNFLIQALVPGSAQDLQLRRWLLGGEFVNLNAIVLTEFLCGPVSDEHMRLALELFPSPEPYLPDDSRICSRLVQSFGPKARQFDGLYDCRRNNAGWRIAGNREFGGFSPFRSTGPPAHPLNALR